MSELQTLIEQAWEDRASIDPQSASAELRDGVSQALADLDQGRARVAEKIDGEWVVHQWLKMRWR